MTSPLLRSAIGAFAICLAAPGLPFQPALHAQEASTAANIPLSVYGDLPEVQEAAMSPSGRRIATILTIEGKQMLLFIQDGSTILGSVNVDSLKVRGIEWAGEERVVLTVSSTRDLADYFYAEKQEFYVAMVVPVDPNERGGFVFANKKNLENSVFGSYGIRQIDGRWYGFYGAIELRRDGGDDYTFVNGRPYLHRVDLQDLSTKRVDTNARQSEYKDWLIGADGEIAATFVTNRESGAWRITNSSGKTIAEGKSDTGGAGVIGLGEDGQSVIYFTRDDDWNYENFEVPLGGGASRPFLDGVDVDRLYFEDATGHMIGYLTDEENPKPVFSDPVHKDAATKVRRAFSNLDMRMVNWTDDLQKMIVRTSGNGDSGRWFAVDVANLSAKAFAFERTAIQAEQVGPISTFSYLASDGTELDGILTLPPGVKPENLPVVILPHGGPSGHDWEEFDWWAQAFASRGYAVFQPNFRGSTNRDNAFRRAGHGEWGGKMQSDKSDGLAALGKAGIVDVGRACIVGASYGGYAALAGVTLQQGIYQCAVAVAPVTDLERMYDDYRASRRSRTTKVALLEQLGPKEFWDAVSPERQAHRADAPILLIHGKDDSVVPFEHSTRMADALKDAGKPHEFVTLEGEDHWLSRSETRRQMLEAAVSFVEKHNPAD